MKICRKWLTVATTGTGSCESCKFHNFLTAISVNCRVPIEIPETLFLSGILQQETMMRHEK